MPPTVMCSILVVDDDPTILDTLAESLDLEGYPVATAANGAEALQVMMGSAADVVLLDMRMPVIDGWGFARAMREHGFAPKLVVMTAAMDAQQWAREVRADDFLAKPFDLDDVLAAVERQCASVSTN
jgi:two-component system chemotaxis response regulator CheY